MPNVLYDALFAAQRTNSSPFIVSPDNSTLSYEAFIRQTSQMANALKTLGAQPGDRVLVQVHKSVAALCVYAACVQSGCIFIPLNTAYTTREVEYFINDAEPSLVICDPAVKDNLQAVTPTTIATLDSNGEGSLIDTAAQQPDDFTPVSRTADDLAAILYTSGTTGRSKGAMLTHNNLLSNALTLVDYWQFSNSDVLLHALPIYHTHGLFVASNTVLLSGSSMIFLPKFDTEEMLQHLPAATTMMGVPTFYTRLLADNRLNTKLVAHMRLFISGSAPLLADTHTEFEQRTGKRILERYGMTETNMSTSNPYDGERIAGTVGFALPGVDARICDPQDGHQLAVDEIGVLEVRGPNVFSGYWRMPEKTAEEFRDDGFFITGDLAKIDNKGYLQIVGRDKDLIISGGFNIYPKEIELLIDDVDGVLESAVVAAPHPDFGEGVVACIVAEQGADINVADIKSKIANDIAKFKQPKSYLVIPELPRNAMGKVQKKLLREQVKNTFSA